MKNTALIEQINKKIKWVIENEEKYYFWVPITTFVLGGLYVIITNKMKKNTKIVVNETCIICYANPRSVII